MAMSSQYGAGLPIPPPPPPAPAPGVGARRILVRPPTITTSLPVQVVQHGAYLQTPLSAASINTPFSPWTNSSHSSVPSSASRGSSPMAVRAGPTPVVPYNPGEWSRHGPINGAFVPHSASTATSNRTLEVTGMEAAMPSPPPPYSPRFPPGAAQPVHTSPATANTAFPASQNTSPTTFPSGLMPSANSLASMANAPPNAYGRNRTVSASIANASPNPGSAPSFPPPPPRSTRDRSTSRTRPDGQRSLFSLSALAARNRQADQAAPGIVDSSHWNISESSARAPAPSLRPQQANLPSDSPYGERRWTPDDQPRAPASRRAASTGGIGTSGTPSRSRTESRSPPGATGWEPGMPLPPPPPGPPPSGARSQSLSRTERSYSSSPGSDTPVAAPRPRRIAQIGTNLGPVPPTPADWVDETAQDRSRTPSGSGLRINTSDLGESHVTVANAAQNLSTAEDVFSPSSSGLTRTGARRDPSVKGIRERRSESRAARERSETRSAVEPSNNPWALEMAAAAAIPADLVLTTPNGAICQRRNAVKTSPKSAKKFSPLDGQPSARAKKSYGDLQTPSSSHSTPRITLSQRVMSPEAFVPTPPFSPGTEAAEVKARSKVSSAVPPKALPTPPIQRHVNESAVSDSSLSVTSDQSKDRPISHILHSPNEDTTLHAPLVPSKPLSTGLPAQPFKAGHYDDFAQFSIERHRAFVEKEIAASSDQERLELFAAFIVNESRLRRDRYSAAFDFMASDILDLTRDMWRPYSSMGKRSATPNASAPQSATDAWRPQSSADNNTQSHRTSASSAPSSAGFIPRTEPDSPANGPNQTRSRGESQTWTAFHPCLSPIPSMSVSEVNDEEASRGRSSSRWWEESANGSVGRGGKVQRTKRESKYMGVPREARETLQWYDDRSPSHRGGTPGPSQQNTLYGPNDYPLEKVGLHDPDRSSPPPEPTPKYQDHRALATPDSHKLDVSRLVTLPPPYPRHHPAVNNNHPDLASIRAIYRTLSDFEDATATKEEHKKKTDAQREQQRAAVNELRSQLRHNIQENIRNGLMSFADAAKAEADFEATQARREQEQVQAEFDSFQKEVFTPLYALFSERITKASASIDHLRSSLFNDALGSDPNQAQEEGDEQPELLEKLTLLKWLFETRQQLHHELFQLENLRNDRYKQVVITPYKASGNDDKVREAEQFFARDTQDRKVAFEKETLRRFEDFHSTVEGNVTRGVEVQLSAFWDIAPGLLGVIQRVPSDLQGFDIVIPPAEYEENSSYHDHPLQYLYSLLAHAEKSAYQFIESQVNLLCLLHEVKTGVMTANSKLLETQRYLAGEDFAEVDREMRGVRREEDARLTEDLKEKVAVVEGLWEEALGGALRECKERVEGFLLETGGWDEGLQE